MSSSNIFVLSHHSFLHSSFKCLNGDYQVRLVASPQCLPLPVESKKGASCLIAYDLSHSDSWDGIRLAKKIRAKDKTTPIIFLTRESSEEFALAVLRAGVNDYLTEPISSKDLQASITRCLPPLAKQMNDRDPKTNKPDLIEETLVGQTKVMRDLRDYIAKVAATDSNVLITGETGTGKELVAGAIHAHNQRRNNPYICVNCAAIPDMLWESELFGYERGAFTGAIGTSRGKMELAQEGTILFDEIGDMGPFAQAKILRAIEERKIYRLGGKEDIDLNVRVIAATNQDLDKLMTQGHFRKDLYYRLNVARIHLPALRERKEDIPILLRHFIGEFNRKFKRQVDGFNDEALVFFLNYTWPGNVRELKNLVEATFINLPVGHISLIELPQQFYTKAKECAQLPQTEQNQILSALVVTNWNRDKAAEKLQCSRMTLYRKMLKHNLSHKEGTQLNGKKLLNDKFITEDTTLLTVVSNM